MDNSSEQDIIFKERKRILLLGLPWTFTKYIITDDMITVDSGFFKVEENDCYMYKVQDVKLTATLMERIFRLGTITCYTGDVTHSQLVLQHVKHAREIKNYLLQASEEARMRRRTLNTLNIGADVDDADMADGDE